MRSSLLLLFGLAACSSMQEGYREANNKELEGTKAPAVSGGVFVGDDEAAFRAADYRVLAFFKPT
ncbi:MAG: hypothetical protein AAGD14_11095 [Planctomycetota bacterium]